jgi:hypothetical protein
LPPQSVRLASESSLRDLCELCASALAFSSSFTFNFELSTVDLPPLTPLAATFTSRLVNVANKRLINHADATLTKNCPVTSVDATLTKNAGEGVASARHSPLITSSTHRIRRNSIPFLCSRTFAPSVFERGLRPSHKGAEGAGPANLFAIARDYIGRPRRTLTVSPDSQSRVWREQSGRRSDANALNQERRSSCLYIQTRVPEM